MRKIQVNRIEYETNDGTIWNATVLSYNMQDAIDYIRRGVPQFKKYISTQIIGDVDGVEKKVVQDYFTRTEVIETIMQAPQQVKAKKTPEDDEEDGGLLTCAWCQKTYKTTKTLGTHIKRFHLE